MMISSFDIFDTCLVRKCGEAKYMFDILAEKAFGRSVSSEHKRAFVAARIEAEKKTWSDSQTLHDIYSVFNYSHADILPKEKLIEYEQEVERQILCPIDSVVERISFLRKQGHRILFISDMYLSHDFLLQILQEKGIWEEGDTLYVSNKVGATKYTGELFKYIHKSENIAYKDWCHYGDNKYSDVKKPRKLGIRAYHISHLYTPYQCKMKEIPSLHYQWSGIMAGISRSIALQSERSAHNSFVLDIIAPLYVSFVHRILENASYRGINSLYFCARDAYPLYRIALKMQSLFPNVTISYLYISRKSLYEGDDNKKIGYFKQIGLASNSAKTAIVDVRSSGRTLQVINELMVQNRYHTVFGYFFEICHQTIEQLRGLDYYAELDDLYIKNLSHILHKLPNNWYMYELYFPLNTQKRTIGYKYEDKEYRPIMEVDDKKEYRLENLQERVEWRNWALDRFTEDFIQLGLNKYSNNIFSLYALPQLAEFFYYPHKFYLEALENFFGLHPCKGYIPYVDKSILRLPMNIIKHRTMWKRGTIFYSLPTWLIKQLYKNK
jgi:predicted HAD superfamily hydrolase